MSFDTNFKIIIEKCAICRNNLDDKCIECEAYNIEKISCTHSIHTNCKGHFINPDTKKECIIKGNACCPHYFHEKCINRWLKKRNCCPLCMSEWIDSKDLSLSERIVATWLNDPVKILEYCVGDIDLDPKIDNFFLTHNMSSSRIKITKNKKEILARLFVDVLDKDHLEKMLAIKNSFLNKGIEKQKSALESKK